MSPFDHLTRVDDTATLRELTESVEKPTRWNGRRMRALHPFDPADLALLRAVNHGEFSINGLRTAICRRCSIPLRPPTTNRPENARPQ